MISYFVGIIEEINKESVSLLTNSGICFKIFTNCNKTLKRNDKIKLYIFTYIKEGEISFYGFKEKDELECFNLLNEVNGIGPKTALQILKNIDSNRLFSLIVNKNYEELSLVNGIGNKAERIILELYPKVKKFPIKDIRYDNVFNALISLGYDLSKINKVISKIENGLSDSEALKEAIKRLKNDK